PVMLLGDNFYDLKIKTKCDIAGCGAEMHIEEYNGEFIAVCNADRSHLRRLDCSALNPNSDKSVDESCSNVKEIDESEINSQAEQNKENAEVKSNGESQ
ncbi:MAG: hypothetical protein K2O95_04435, partial [Clostridia bacterium]|nr:hypothetical protein [Clostridia bacterium]